MSALRIRRGERAAQAESSWTRERREGQELSQPNLPLQKDATRKKNHDGQTLQIAKLVPGKGPATEEPAAFSYAWCKVRIRIRIRAYWQGASAWVRAVIFVLTFVMIFIIAWYVYRYVFGLWFYCEAYWWAKQGFDYSIDGCDRATMSRQAFWMWTWDQKGWFNFMSCQAYNRASDLDGYFSPEGQAIAMFIIDPLSASPTIYLLCVSLFAWKGIPWIARKIRTWTGSVWNADAPFWAWVFWFCLIMSLLFLNAHNLGTFAVLIGLCFVALIVFYVILDVHFINTTKTAWGAANNLPLTGPILRFFSWICGIVSSIWRAWKDPPWAVRNPHNCYHIDSCGCYVEKDRQVLKLSKNNEMLQREVQTLQTNLETEKQLLQHANINLGLVTGERDTLERRLSGPMPSPGHWHAPRHDDARSSYWQQQYLERDREYAQLANEKWEQEKAYKLELEKLHKAVTYSHGAGVDRENAIKEMYDAKAIIRNQEREINALSVAGMNLRQELAKEKESHSEKCQNEASCQKRIRELEENYDRAMAHIREDQTLVTDACVALGMDRKEAEHVQLRAYLADATIQIAKLYAMGVRGADTTDLQVEIMRKEVARETTYKNRLEREVERLGGNILDIRLGLDTTRPQDWKVEFVTYEQNLLRIFPIYQRLWNAINDMYEVYAREKFLPPGWISKPPRNDMSSNVLTLPPPEAALQLVKANEITNPHIGSFEVLVEKLVWNECLRLYNHGLEMLMLLDSNMTVHATVEGIEGVNQILNEVLHEVLDHIPAFLDRHPTERSLGPRKQKKYEIYSAMQTAIAGLLMTIIANKRMPPDWLSTQTYDDRFNKPYATPENLVANLVNHEMTILAKRIQQLVAFTEEYHLPGTRAGPPRAVVQHDPMYQKRWDHLVIARTFAELTISHWNVHKSQKEVIHIDEAGRRLIRFEPDPQLLPLNMDQFRVAVGLSPLKKEDEHWPQDWKATLINDPSSGPYILFEPPAPATQQARATEYPGSGTASDPNHHNNQNNANNTNNNNQVALVGSPKEIERKKLQNEWKEHQERCQQLYNHVVGYGIKDHIPRLNMVNLRANADPKSMRRDIESFKEAENQYVHALSRGKFIVPPMKKKGGKMHPFG